MIASHLTAAQCHGTAPVTARREIADNPLSRLDDGATKGERGYVQDTDQSASLLFVSFSGRDAIACLPEEVR